jgi:hypothetical protein
MTKKKKKKKTSTVKREPFHNGFGKDKLFDLINK